MSAFTDLLEETFDARKCPLTAKAFLGHRFVLPNYRSPDYFSQDELNRMALMNLILLGMPDSEHKIDEVTRGTVCNVLQALSCGRPTLFLEKELGAILLDSHLPEDLGTGDIMRPFPSLRIMLPRGLLTIKRDEVSSMMFLDIGFLDGNVDVRCDRAIAAELDLNAIIKWGTNLKDRFWLSRMSFSYDETCMLVSGSLDKGETDLAPTAYGITKPWKAGPLSVLKQYRGDLQTDWPSDETDHVLMGKMENLALNILLLLSRVPIEYEPLHIERKERQEGKRIIPALLRAKFVGDCMLRARKAGFVRGELNGYEATPHWVRAHWRNQAHGKGYSLRKLIWILPYHVGKEQAA